MSLNFPQIPQDHLARNSASFRREPLTEGTGPPMSESRSAPALFRGPCNNQPIEVQSSCAAVSTKWLVWALAKNCWKNGCVCRPTPTFSSDVASLSKSVQTSHPWRGNCPGRCFGFWACLPSWQLVWGHLPALLGWNSRTKWGCLGWSCSGWAASSRESCRTPAKRRTAV